MRFIADPGGRTYVGRQYASYPFHLCRMLYQDPALPALGTLYMQSCSGGIYQHDRHTVEIHGGAGTNSHLTTQASTIVHSMPDGRATQAIEITTDANAYLEFLPDPQILFPGSELSTTTRLSVGQDGLIVFCDSFLTHRPGGTPGYPRRYSSEIIVEDHRGRTLAIDRLHLDAAAFSECAPGNLRDFSGCGTMLAVGSIDAAEINAPALTESSPAAEVGMTELPNRAGLMFRIMARDGVALRQAMQTAWRQVRLAKKGHEPAHRRK